MSPAEVSAARDEVVLRAGDVAYFPPNLSGEIRNDGAERAVGLAFLVVQAGMVEASPAAGTSAS